MRTVVSSNEIAHLWAHQKQRVARSGSMSLRGNSFSSYATEIGRVIKNRSGEVAYLLSERTHSQQTSGQLRALLHAIPPGAVIFRMNERGGFYGHPGLPANNDKAMYDICIENAANSASKAIACSKRAFAKKRQYEADQSRWLEQAKAVVKFFGLRYKVDENTIAKLAKSKAEEEKKRAKALGAYIAQCAALDEENLALWLAGEEVAFPHRIDRVYFRRRSDIAGIKIANWSVETSRGVFIHPKEAKLALAFCRKHRHTGWRENGDQYELAGYKLNSISETGVIAGCHRVTWEEIERFANLMGW